MRNIHSKNTLNGYLGLLAFYQQQNTQNNTATASRTSLVPGAFYGSYPISVSASSNYYLLINKYNPNHLGIYEINTSFVELTTTDTDESNNNASTAAVNIPTDPTKTATLGYGGDIEDWYYFVAPSDGKFKVALQNFHAKNTLVPSALDGALEYLYIYDESEVNAKYLDRIYYVVPNSTES